MQLVKKDLQKLAIYSHYLDLYLNSWKSTNIFYYSDKRILEILEVITQKHLKVKEVNVFVNTLDKEDRDRIKDILTIKELRFKASPEAKSYFYDFAQEHYTIEDQRQADFTLEPLKCDKCGYIGEVSRNQSTLEFSCAWCGESYK